jgi:hypothetical protein
MECQELVKKKGGFKLLRYGFRGCKCDAKYQISEVNKPDVVMCYVCRIHAKFYQNLNEFYLTTAIEQGEQNV